MNVIGFLRIVPPVVCMALLAASGQYVLAGILWIGWMVFLIAEGVKDRAIAEYLEARRKGDVFKEL